MKRFLVISAGLVAAYLIVGNVWHLLISPLRPADPSTYPVAGDRFASRAEGAVMEIVRVEGGMVAVRSQLDAGAAGPPPHVHVGFDETFVPIEGVLHVQLGDSIVRVQPGDTLHIPAGTPHRPFNPTDRPVRFGGDRLAMPQAFAANLVQIYRFMDERGTSPLAMALQMSVMDRTFDSQLAAVPATVDALTRILIAPAARVAGYRNWYPEYALHAPK